MNRRDTTVRRSITSDPCVYKAGYWLDGVWTALPFHDEPRPSQVKSIAISESNVYAAGYSTNSSGKEVPGYWLNGTWTALTPVDGTQWSEVNAIAISQ